MYNDFSRYLSSKKTVDDRALNAQVWQRLEQHLRTRSGMLQVVELGSGIGTMLERMVEQRLFHLPIVYTLLDEMDANIQSAQERLSPLVGQQTDIGVKYHAGDAFAFADDAQHQGAFDLLIANAFLDLVNLPEALRRFLPLLRPDGLFYFSITFDGVTGFYPPIDGALDAKIERLYHADMDARRHEGKVTGGSLAGRALLHAVLQSGAEVLAAGSSDWVVYPQDGRYVADEAYFLHAIVETIHGALSAHPDLKDDDFSGWIATRHAQIDRAELIYIAHQLDIVGRVQRL